GLSYLGVHGIAPCCSYRHAPRHRGLLRWGAGASPRSLFPEGASRRRPRAQPRRCSATCGSTRRNRVSRMNAYLDAGTGSMIAAALAGGIAGIGVLFRMYGNRFLGIFSKKRRELAERERAELIGAVDDEG